MSRAILALALAVSAHAALMPLPWKMTTGTGRMRLDSSFRVVNTGCPEEALSGTPRGGDALQ
jgi:hypothetical protein